MVFRFRQKIYITPAARLVCPRNIWFMLLKDMARRRDMFFTPAARLLSPLYVCLYCWMTWCPMPHMETSSEVHILPEIFSPLSISPDNILNIAFSSPLTAGTKA